MRRSFVEAGLLPGVAVLVIAGILAHRDTPIETIALFAAYAAVGITAPGAVLWRLATGHRRNLVEDLSAGFLLGTAVQLLVYLAVSAADLQRWAWLWAVPVLAAATAVRRLHECWWGLAAACAVVVLGWSLARRDRSRAAVVVPIAVIGVGTAAGVLPALESTVTQSGATSVLFQPREQGGPTGGRDHRRTLTA
jgi:hypothetical protein